MLREMEFAKRVPNLMYTTSLFNDLGLDATQQAKMKEIRDRVQQRQQGLPQEFAKLHAAGGEDVAKQMTPEQRLNLCDVLEQEYDRMIQLR